MTTLERTFVIILTTLIIAGKIPLPPKYALGYWWSRYWQYSDYEFAELAETALPFSWEFPRVNPQNRGAGG